MVYHTIDDGLMMTSAGPTVSRSEGLEDHKRLIEFDGPFQGAIEREIPGKPACRSHPIQNEVAIAGGRIVTQGAQACTGNSRVHTLQVHASEQEVSSSPKENEQQASEVPRKSPHAMLAEGVTPHPQTDVHGLWNE